MVHKGFVKVAAPTHCPRPNCYKRDRRDWASIRRRCARSYHSIKLVISAARRGVGARDLRSGQKRGAKSRRCDRAVITPTQGEPTFPHGL